MSEKFEAGLRDLYTTAELALGPRSELAVDLMIARTRRRRRTRAAAISLATAAAVAGIAIGGNAVVRTLGDAPAPPAGDPTPTQSSPADLITGSELFPECGVDVGEIRRPPEDQGLTVDLSMSGGDPNQGTMTGRLRLRAEDVPRAWESPQGDGLADDYELVVVSDGAVVGTVQTNRYELPRTGGDLRTYDVRMAPVACDGGVLDPGEYTVVASLMVNIELAPDTWESVVVLSEPQPLTVPEVTGLPDPQDHVTWDGHSAWVPADRSVPLRDGAYVATVSDVDPVSGTVSVDLVVAHFGQSALDWLRVTEPGSPEPEREFVLTDPDGPDPRTLPIGEAQVWERTWSDAGRAWALRQGGVAEWAAAPTDGRESHITDDARMPRGGLYWLDLRDGVVMQVIGLDEP